MGALPGQGSLGYVEHFDTDGSLGGWSIWGLNWDVDDSILEVYPLGTGWLYIAGWPGIPWPDIDIHMGIKAGDYTVKVQIWVDTWNGTSWCDVYGSIWTIDPEDGWKDIYWDENELENALVDNNPGIGTSYNITDIEFQIWDSFDNGDSAFIDYIGTNGDDWCDDVQDELDAIASSSIATTSTSTSTTTITQTTNTETDGGGNPFLVGGADNPVTAFLALEYSIVEGLLSGETDQALISITLMLVQGAIITLVILALLKRGKK